MSQSLTIPAIKVRQWLNDWDKVTFDNKTRHKPQEFFYVFSIKASVLKRLSKVYPRKANDRRHTEIGIQRKHDPERSDKIRDFVFGGFPWSDLSEQKQKSNEYSDLKMPGWLPTAIIANILAPNTQRGAKTIEKKHTIKINDSDLIAQIILPDSVTDKNWDPDIPPLEIIDGQHRLWAFEKDEKLNGDFELPVVAFYNLDISWQAYLFYTINIKPKKINASLAFDLYPILRVQEWLERSPEGALIYKETRAQEIVEVLWSHSKSPWKDRINMLGETNTKTTVTQAALIRNLVATFVKTSTTRNLGGLYGSLLKDGNPLVWDRTQQAAFIIYVWQIMVDNIKACEEPWATKLRTLYKDPQAKLFEEISKDEDPAFVSRYSLISTDQGVRGFLHIINDLVYYESSDLGINSITWQDEKVKEDRIDEADVTKAISQFKKSTKLNEFLSNLCAELAKFDWRTSSEPSLTDQERRSQMIFKGSSGYKELRMQLLQIIAKSQNTKIKESALAIQSELGYDD